MLPVLEQRARPTEPQTMDVAAVPETSMLSAALGVLDPR
jgi:hypothetical protein